MTQTSCALGAQTAKCVPAFPSCSVGWAPSQRYVVQFVPRLIANASFGENSRCGACTDAVPVCDCRCFEDVDWGVDAVGRVMTNVVSLVTRRRNPEPPRSGTFHRRQPAPPERGSGTERQPELVAFLNVLKTDRRQPTPPDRNDIGRSPYGQKCCDNVPNRNSRSEVPQRRLGWLSELETGLDHPGWPAPTTPARPAPRRIPVRVFAQLPPAT